LHFIVSKGRRILANTRCLEHVKIELALKKRWDSPQIFFAVAPRQRFFMVDFGWKT
jgi:hypothetical protein